MADKKSKKKTNYSEQGKKNRNSGRIFEAKVREDLEKMGWVVNKWVNTIDYSKNKIVPAKRKYNPFLKALSIGTGFPDFIAFRNNNREENKNKLMKGFCDNCKKESFGYETSKGFITCNNCGDHLISTPVNQAEVIGLEVKGNGYLDQVEKGMCFWLIENKIFSKILIAKKNKNSKKTEIEYINFLDKYKKDIPIQ